MHEYFNLGFEISIRILLFHFCRKMNENSSNNELSDNDSSIPIKKKAKPKWRHQAFCPRWKKEFKDVAWFANVEDDKYKVKCLACNKILSAGKSEIQKHEYSSLSKKC